MKTEQTKYLLTYNLSFFADNDAGEKTEKPTPRKKGKARKEGQVARSQEVGTAVMFLCAFIGLRVFGASMFASLESIVLFNLMHLDATESLASVDYMRNYFTYMFGRTLLVAMPIMALTMSMGLVANFAQVKWKPTSKPLKPKLSKLNPVNGAKRLFSPNQLIELPKSIIKLLIVGIALYSIIMREIPTIFKFSQMEPMSAMGYIGKIAIDMGIRVGLLYLILAVFDYPYQRYRHTKSLKMTKQEVKEERKMVEGDPRVKRQIRKKMMEISFRRMMQEVPTADVIITNPTHYAVAVKYDREVAAAPIVVAKGVDYLAKKIREKAMESNVEIIENKPLAKALYNTVDIGREIPAELYKAVAEVLAFVYNLRNNKFN